MKGKGFTQGNRYLAGVLYSGCWVVVRPGSARRQGRLRQFVARYRDKIDLILSVVAIGGMFLAGIWGFLIQLAAV